MMGASSLTTTPAVMRLWITSALCARLRTYSTADCTKRVETQKMARLANLPNFGGNRRNEHDALLRVEAIDDRI